MKPHKWAKVISKIKLIMIKNRCDVRGWYFE